MNVAELLNAKGNRIVTTRRQSSIQTIMHRMALERIGAIVVTGTGGDRIVGIISERDIARGLAEHGTELLTMHAVDLMTHSVRTCAPQDGVKQVMALMTLSRIRHLPVTDDRGLCGIISIGDVVKYRLEETNHEVNALRDSCIAGRHGRGFVTAMGIPWRESNTLPA